MNHTYVIDARQAATLALAAVISGQSLNQCLPPLEADVPLQDRAFLRDLVLGSCRHYQRLNALAKILLIRPFGDDEQDLHALLIIGLYQLAIQKKAPHAAVHATVAVCELLDKSHAKGVINACLRRYGREYDEIQPALDDNPVTATSHPKWLVKMLKKAWPEHWQTVLQQNNQQAPLCLRVNCAQQTRQQYLAHLQQAGIAASAAQHSPYGIYLEESCDITQLPGFDDGWFSVQDEAAQLAATLLAPQDDEYILDACAAPGGKTGHLLELADAEVTALDIEAKRLERVEENLNRLQLNANILCADLAQPEQWWQGYLYDAILLDAPCSATGVIRRHPDIKLLRRREDIAQLTELQTQLLETAWRLLKPGGRLLYATCSVLPQENSQKISQFCQLHPEAKLATLNADWGVACDSGRQLFPQATSHDGFYYALLHKRDAE